MNGMIWWADSPHPESYTKCPAFSLMETPRAPELSGNALLCPGCQLVISTHSPFLISLGGAKIYDPTKGLRVNATAEFETADKLKLRGTILGVGVTLYWTRIK